MSFPRTLRLLILVAFVGLAFTSCQDKGYNKVTYVANVPIYMSYEDFRAQPIVAEAARPLTNPGKIFLKDHLLFVNDKFHGIHIIDNTSPSAPVNMAYIPLPGNVDIAVRGHIMYVDNYVDLVTIDISDPMNPIVLSRNERVFPNALPVWNFDYPIAPIDPAMGVVVGWEEKEITVKEDMHPNSSWGNLVIMSDQAMSEAEIATVTTANNLTPGTGISGSMARFALNGDYLYTVNDNTLTSFDISTPEQPSSGSAVAINRTVETVAPMSDYLFIGTNSGMLIYKTTDNPLTPEYVSTFVHATMCDPVMVDGDYAYITLRGGTFCGGWGDRLDVVDISDVYWPNLIETVPMTSPYGLAKAEDLVFVCDGSNGLRVLDASNPNNLEPTDHISGINAYDVIPFDQALILVGADGLYQFDYSNPNNLQQLSVIPVE